MEHFNQTPAQPNPLTQYFRSFKLYMKLPSGSSFYRVDEVQYTESGEVGVMPMTGRDELSLKNPDALLNGEALVEVITSCVPSVKNPRALLTNDIDALITAIRYATYNDSLETSIHCPKCSYENSYKLDLQYALDNMSYLEDEYIVNLPNGLSVFVKPYSFPDMLKGLHAEFEQTKLARALESNNISEEEKSAIFSDAFKKIAITKFDLMCSGIVKVVDELRNVNVTDKKHIREFLQNIDKKSVDQIGDLIDEINQVGIRRSFTAKCNDCGHEWESEIDFNPVNFS